ncbi:hypothetical protein Q3A80_31830, partial [Burkholderia sp. SR8]
MPAVLKMGRWSVRRVQEAFSFRRQSPKRTPAGEQEYEWDEFDRLLRARVAETSRQSQARYFYDAFGRRIAKEVNGERTVFGWDGD